MSMYNMADVRNFETVATQASLILETYNAVYGPSNNVHYVP